MRACSAGDVSSPALHHELVDVHGAARRGRMSPVTAQEVQCLAGTQHSQYMVCPHSEPYLVYTYRLCSCTIYEVV